MLIYNSLARDKQAFQPINPGSVRMYVCGMTVYDYCHLGHARVMVVFDVVYRWLMTSGFEVNYVRNITDIDDKIIKRAVENNEPIDQLTGRFIQFMHEDEAKLGILPPTHEPRATQFVPGMVDMIQILFIACERVVDQHTLILRNGFSCHREHRGHRENLGV